MVGGSSRISVNILHNRRNINSTVVEMVFNGLLSLVYVESHLFLWHVSHRPFDVPELVG